MFFYGFGGHGLKTMVFIVFMILPQSFYGFVGFGGHGSKNMVIMVFMVFLKVLHTLIDNSNGY